MNHTDHTWTNREGTSGCWGPDSSPPVLSLEDRRSILGSEFTYHISVASASRRCAPTSLRHQSRSTVREWSLWAVLVKTIVAPSQGCCKIGQQILVQLMSSSSRLVHHGMAIVTLARDDTRAVPPVRKLIMFIRGLARQHNSCPRTPSALSSNSSSSKTLSSQVWVSRAKRPADRKAA